MHWKRNINNSFLRLFVLSRCTSRQNVEMEFHFFLSSFCRVGQGAKTNKQQNAKTRFHFFVLSRCTSHQNEEMELHFFVSSFCRVGEGAKTNKRQNAKTKFHFFVCSFCRVVQVAKTKKCNFISSFFCFVAFPKAQRNEKTTKLPQNIKVWFVVVACSFCRLFVLSTSTRR